MYFWFIPILLVVVIGIWTFYYKILKESGPCERTSGKVLVDKPPPPPKPIQPPEW